MPDDRRNFQMDVVHKHVSRRTVIKGCSLLALAGISSAGCNAQGGQSVPSQPVHTSSTATSYAMFREDPLHSGLNTTEHLISSANVAQLELASTFPIEVNLFGA